MQCISTLVIFADRLYAEDAIIKRQHFIGPIDQCRNVKKLKSLKL